MEHCALIGRERRKSFANDTYWARPVANFGDPRGRLLIVGLAPAAHGANRTGRMFTGDRSGEWLFRALHRAGFANQPESVSADDPLRLLDCAITATCHCAPPDNRPSARKSPTAEAGWIARWKSALRGSTWRWADWLAGGWWIVSPVGLAAGPRPKFSHAARVELAGGRWLLGSYHPSQQNTFTGRLTEPMSMPFSRWPASCWPSGSPRAPTSRKPLVSALHFRNRE